VIFADLNDFKRVNDVHGHATGDAVLIECAERLRSCVRAEDTVCRLAGDEFVIMLSGSPDSANAQSVMQKIQQKLAAPYKVSAGEVTVGVSLGVAVYPGDGSDAESLLAAADRAMYSDKRGKHASGVY
jgi:diguanylate cyclase (GGDEF)-like protein